MNFLRECNFPSKCLYLDTYISYFAGSNFYELERLKYFEGNFIKEYFGFTVIVDSKRF